jgi:hypothetical membrane protein
MHTVSTGLRVRALAGVVGPTAFVSAWATGGAISRRDYSPIDDAISRLAAIGADTRPLMTAGFIVFGCALPLFSTALRSAVPGKAWITAAATGIATLGVAATPLDRSAFVDGAHGFAATVGYITLAATPLLAVESLRRAGHRRLALSGAAAGAVSAVSLALSTTSLPTGFFQRLGLTASDCWIVVTAIAIATGRLSIDVQKSVTTRHQVDG